MAVIPYGRQDIRTADIDAVAEVLRSPFLTQGPAVPNFEAAVAAQCGAEHAVAVSSATAALHIACLALDLGPGDLLWTTPISFVASANCGLYCGADVDFVDIDPLTYNLSPEALEAKLIAAEAAGRLPKVVVPVHMTGQPCDMEAIGGLARRFGFRVIEDASHAIGGRYRNQPVGDCRFSDITVFSFHPVKIITTAEGGMALTNDAELSRRMALLRTHGVSRDPAQFARPADGPWYYEQVALGYNYRLTDIQAALGLSQLARLDEYVARRQALARRYDALLADLPLTLPWQHQDSHSAWHLYVIRLPRDHAGITHRALFAALADAGLGVNLHYIPIYRQPYYQRFGFRPDDFPHAESYYAEAITIPLFAAMTDDEQDQVVAALRGALA